jgi:hypothetical protein
MGELPFTCPHCGEPFGFGPDAALLTVVASVPFDEAAPCCGKRITGTLGRYGEVSFAPTPDPLEAP